MYDRAMRIALLEEQAYTAELLSLLAYDIDTRDRYAILAGELREMARGYRDDAKAQDA